MSYSRLTVLFLVWISMRPVAALAVDEAMEASIIQARSNYFNGLVSGQGATPQAQAQLFQSTVGAVNQKNTQDIITRWQNEVVSRTAPPQSVVPADPTALGVDPKIVRDRQAAFSGRKSTVSKGASLANNSDKPNGGWAPHAVPQTTAEVPLDGSKVPRLLDFSGRSPASDSP